MKRKERKIKDMRRSWFKDHLHTHTHHLKRWVDAISYFNVWYVPLYHMRNYWFVFLISTKRPVCVHTVTNYDAAATAAAVIFMNYYWRNFVNKLVICNKFKVPNIVTNFILHRWRVVLVSWGWLFFVVVVVEIYAMRVIVQ